ncbi:hypothetical protein LINPERPRIM_LOCUS15552 [Linum perenne]
MAPQVAWRGFLSQRWVTASKESPSKITKVKPFSRAQRTASRKPRSSKDKTLNCPGKTRAFASKIKPSWFLATMPTAPPTCPEPVLASTLILIHPRGGLNHSLAGHGTFLKEGGGVREEMASRNSSD